MPHRPRVFVPDTSVHVIHRGTNHEQIFVQPADYETFLTILVGAAEHHGVSVHAYALMSTHFHLMVTPRDRVALPQAMKVVGVRYVRYFNRKYDRFGTLWASRYRGILVADDGYGLTCLRYIEQNPVRAGLVSKPDEYRWSSYRAHAGSRRCAWLVPHPVYLGLGPTVESRRAGYRALCAVALAEHELAGQRVSVSVAR
jgi:REP-associated tyrosine transposase